MPEPEYPPVEWVEGDATRSAQFAFALGLFFGGGAVLLILNSLAVWRWVALSSLLGIPGWALDLVIVALLVAELSFLALFPRRYPVISRLGISPTSLQLQLATGKFKFGWAVVSWRAPDQIQVAAGFTSPRYRLTPMQSLRLARFTQRRA